MKIELISCEGFEELWRAADPEKRFTAYIAIYSTKRGPALGGVRFWPYDHERKARADVLLLAKAMAYKAALAGLPHGGGKGVIIQPAGPFDRTVIMTCFGEFVESLAGRYITAKDVGTTSEDMVLFKRRTRYVTGLPIEAGGAGDPSPATAAGVIAGMKVSVNEKLGQKKLAGLSVTIQGLGGVGGAVARQLTEEGVIAWGSDVDPKRLVVATQQWGVHPVLPELIMEKEATIFCPCALGQVLSAETIRRLSCRVVAGGANDPLADPVTGSQQLHDKGILYAPDFVINAGGLIHVAAEWKGYNAQLVEAQIQQIGETLREVYAYALRHRVTSELAARRLAEAKLTAH